MRRLFTVAAAICATTACLSSVGPNGGVVGGPCELDRHCAEECLEGNDFPEGHCTIECDETDDCPQPSVCIDKAGGVCLIPCRDDGDCRPGYDCEDKRERGDDGDERVCIDD